MLYLLILSWSGWNKTWDEWVTDERLLKMTPENMERAKEMEKDIQATKGQTHVISDIHSE